MGLATIYKEMVRSTGVYLGGTMARQALALLFIPVFTRYLTPKDAGIQELLDTTMVVFSMLAGQRIGSGLLYFLARAATPEAKDKVLSTITLGGTGVGVIGGLMGAVAAPWICQLVFQSSEYAFYWRLMCISFAVGIPLEIGWTWLRGENRPGAFVVSNLALAVLNYCIVLILLVFHGMGFRSLVWGTAISSSALALAQTGYMLSKSGLHFDWALFRSMVRYGLPTGLSGLGAFTLHSADRFFLQRFVSLTDVGIYGYSYRLGMLISTLQAAFGSYWWTRSYELLKGDGGRRLLERTLTYVITVAVGLGFVFWVWGRPFVNLFVGPEFRGCLAYYPWILAAYVIRIPADYLRTIFYVGDRTFYDAAVNIGSAVACLGAYAILIPRYGVWGAAWATLAGFSVLALASAILSHRVYPFSPEWKRLFQLGGTTVILGLAYTAIPAPSLIAQAAVAAGLSIAFPAALFLSGFFDSEEREQMNLAVRRLRALFAS